MAYELYPNETTIFLCYMPVEFTLRITHWKESSSVSLPHFPNPSRDSSIKPTYYSKCKGIFFYENDYTSLRDYAIPSR